MRSDYQPPIMGFSSEQSEILSSADKLKCSRIKAIGQDSVRRMFSHSKLVSFQGHPLYRHGLWSWSSSQPHHQYTRSPVWKNTLPRILCSTDWLPSDAHPESLASLFRGRTVMFYAVSNLSIARKDINIGISYHTGHDVRRTSCRSTDIPVAEIFWHLGPGWYDYTTSALQHTLKSLTKDVHAQQVIHNMFSF